MPIRRYYPVSLARNFPYLCAPARVVGQRLSAVYQAKTRFGGGPCPGRVHEGH